MSTSIPCKPLSALAIAHEIAAGTLSPVEALKLGEGAISAYEDQIHAFTARPDTMQPAKGLLSGIAVGIKDIFDTADMPTRHGSPIYQDNQPPADAAIVTQLKNVGATIAGKTVTTEYAWFQPGPTRNPHNLNHTPGGSSSGSAAGVAAGFFPAAIGSQTGGSVLRPAAFCGVAGYKPSFRLFPTIGMKHFAWSLDTPGVFAASVADAAFVAAACSGRDLAVNERTQTPPVIGIYRGSADDQMDNDMANAIDQMAKRAKAWGAAVRTIAGPDAVEAARNAHGPIQDYEARIALAHELRTAPDQLSPNLRAYLEQAEAITPDTYDAARRTANKARKASHDLFQTCDVLLMPSAPGAAAASLETTGDSVFNRMWTLLGVPAINVPGMVDKDGMPLGLQLVARFGRDRKLLQAAHWLETRINRDQ
ncbi:MAG: amidase [Pseudomonadota bacterium]